MSRHTVVEVPCPKCGHQEKFTKWESINTVLDPDMKMKVRTKEAFAFTCPKCRNIFNIDYGFLYHQMEDLMMIYYVTQPGDVEKVHEMFRGDNEIARMIGKDREKYLYRIVQSQNELREKLFIFDSELDDRVIEVLKVFYAGRIQEENPELAIDEIRFELGEDDSINFIFLSEEKVEATCMVERELYNAIEKKYILDRPDLRDDDIVIDFEWALDVIERC